MVAVTDNQGINIPIRQSQGYRVTRTGYLIVWGSRHKTIATFAPGSWASVQCLDQQEQ